MFSWWIIQERLAFNHGSHSVIPVLLDSSSVYCLSTSIDVRRIIYSEKIATALWSPTGRSWLRNLSIWITCAECRWQYIPEAHSIIGNIAISQSDCFWIGCLVNSRPSIMYLAIYCSVVERYLLVVWIQRNRCWNVWSPSLSSWLQ